MNPSATPSRLGTTLMEVMIAVALLMLVYVATFELLANSKQLDAQAAATDEQAIDATNITSAISLDLAMSGWYFETASVDAGDYNGSTRSEDRNTLHYFPYIAMQAVGSRTEALPGTMPWAARAESQVRQAWAASTVNLVRPASLSGATVDSWYAENLTSSFTGGDQTYARSFTARSQELIFLRGTIASWDPRSETNTAYDKSLWETNDLANRSPSESTAPALSFAGTAAAWKAANNHAVTKTLYASGFTRDAGGAYVERTPGIPYGRVLDAGWYDPEATGASNDSPIKVQWETLTPPTYTAADYARTNLREFMYAVVPSPRGLGRLVRAYKIDNTTTGYATGTEVGQVLSVRDATAAGNYRMRVDRILSEDVTRIVFDTCRTAAGVDPNQVRVRIFLARASSVNSKLVVRRAIEQTFAMRARASSGEVTAIQDILGDAVVGLDR